MEDERNETMTAPEAGTPQELQFRLRVDAAHCDRAAQGLRLMAQYQYRGLVRRIEGLAWLAGAQRGVLKVAPAIAAVAFVAGLVVVGVGCVSSVSRPADFALAAALFLEALVLWWLPRRMERIRSGARARFERFFGDRAAALMRKTRRAAPFEAAYDLRGDLLAYSRVVQGRWTPRWHRYLGRYRARGVALQAPGVLAIFRKPGTVVPAMVVLTGDDDGLAAAIRALGWTIVDVDPASSDPAATSAAGE